MIPKGNEKHNQEVEVKGNRLLYLFSSPHSLFRTLTLLCYAAFSSLLILPLFLFFIYLPPALAFPLLLCSAQCKFVLCPSWPPAHRRSTEKVLIVTPVNACEVAVCLPLQAAPGPHPQFTLVLPLNEPPLAFLPALTAVASETVFDTPSMIWQPKKKEKVGLKKGEWGWLEWLWEQKE